MKNLIIIFFWTCAVSAYAQIPRPPREPSTTRHLKDMYAYINGKITANQYYLNEIRINPNKLVGKDEIPQSQSYFFYYNYDGENKPVLRLIASIYTKGKVETRTDLMYDQDGNLSYCIETQNDSTQKHREFHVFFEKELCINLIIDKEIIDQKDTKPYKTKIEEIQRLGKALRTKFKETTHNIITADY